VISGVELEVIALGCGLPAYLTGCDFQESQRLSCRNSFQYNAIK